jgi:hypothetical protein
MKLQTATLLLALVSAASAEAQDGETAVAASFEQLQVLVTPGSVVMVTDPSGSVTSGVIETLSPSTLSLLVDDTRRTFGEMDVDLIRQRRGDSLANGAWWGFGIGAGLAVAVLRAYTACDVCDGELGPGEAAAAVIVYGAMGTGVGVGIDALIRRHRTIYRRPGLAVSVRF